MYFKSDLVFFTSKAYIFAFSFQHDTGTWPNCTYHLVLGNQMRVMNEIRFYDDDLEGKFDERLLKINSQSLEDTQVGYTSHQTASAWATMHYAAIH